MTKKRNQYDFTIWLNDGSRIRWRSTRTQPVSRLIKAIEDMMPIAKVLRKHQRAADPTKEPR